MMRIALDTNILAYFAGVATTVDDRAKILVVQSLIETLGQAASLVAPAQALGELFIVLRRSGASSEDARAVVLEFLEGFGCAATEAPTVTGALDLAVDHKLQFWDALIVTAAAEAGCSLLLSEDMQDGFVVRGLTIVNPLAATPHSRLAAVLKQG